MNKCNFTILMNTLRNKIHHAHKTGANIRLRVLPAMTIHDMLDRHWQACASVIWK